MNLQNNKINSKIHLFDIFFMYFLFMNAQLTTEIASLREQLAGRETELAEIKQLKATPAQNGLPANDQLKVSFEFISNLTIVFIRICRMYDYICGKL